MFPQKAMRECWQMLENKVAGPQEKLKIEFMTFIFSEKANTVRLLKLYITEGLGPSLGASSEFESRSNYIT